MAAAPSIDFYAWTKIAEAGEETLGFVYPPELTVINPDSIALLKGAPNRKVAQAFIEFVLSEKGQKLWLLPIGAKDGPKQFTLARMSVLPYLYDRLGKEAVVKVNPFKFKPGFRYDSQKGDARIDVLNSLMGAFLVDTHRQLKAAWERAAFKPRGESGTHKPLFHPPVSEAEVMKLAKKWATDRKLAVRKETQWVRLAKQRYGD